MASASISIDGSSATYYSFAQSPTSLSPTSKTITLNNTSGVTTWTLTKQSTDGYTTLLANWTLTSYSTYYTLSLPDRDGTILLKSIVNAGTASEDVKTIVISVGYNNQMLAPGETLERNATYGYAAVDNQNRYFAQRYRTRPARSMVTTGGSTINPVALYDCIETTGLNLTEKISGTVTLPVLTSGSIETINNNLWCQPNGGPYGDDQLIVSSSSIPGTGVSSAGATWTTSSKCTIMATFSYVGNPNGSGTTGMLCGFFNSGTSGTIALAITPTAAHNIQAYVQGGTAFGFGIPTITQGQYNTAVITCNGTATNLYVNGIHHGTVTTANIGSPTGSFFFRKGSGGTECNYLQRVVDMRVYADVLNPTSISYYHNSLAHWSSF